MYKLILFVVGCGLTGFLVAHTPAPRLAPQRYNVLFIVADDWKPTAGCYRSADAGTRQIKTPNIDRLAAKGTVFRRNYCQQAVCAPTRASLLTGQRPDYTRVWDLETQIRAMNPDILTMPQYFRQQGYVTTGIGKVYDGRSVDKAQDSLSWSVPYHRLAGFGAAFQMYRNPQTRQRLDRLEAEAWRRAFRSGHIFSSDSVPLTRGRPLLIRSMPMEMSGRTRAESFGGWLVSRFRFSSPLAFGVRICRSSHPKNTGICTTAPS